MHAVSTKPAQVLFPGVYLLKSEVGGRPLMIPLLVGSDRAVLIYSGCAAGPEEFILPALAQLGVPLTHLGFVITTHCDFDHQGGNAALKKAAPQALICCGAADRPAVESPRTVFDERYNAYGQNHQHAYDDQVRAEIFSHLGAAQPVDLTFVGGESPRLEKDWDIEILHMPGHSHGHLGVWDRKHNIVFGGDAIQGTEYLDTHGNPALCPTYLPVQPYLDTIARIESMGLDSYSGCRWPVARDNTAVKAFCRESRAFVARAEAGIRAAILAAEAGGTTLKELCFDVGSTLGAWPKAANHEMCYAFAGHLEDLGARGLIRRISDTTPYRYSSAQ